MPVHPHHRTKALEPERVANTAQHFILAIIHHNSFHHGQTQLCHPLGQPARHISVMQRQASTSRSLHANKISKNGGELQTAISKHQTHTSHHSRTHPVQ